MKKDTKEPKKNVGRPSAFNDEKILDKRIKIFVSHFYEKLPYWELEKKYEVSSSTVKKAIEFVQKNFVKIPTKTVLAGAIFSIESRIKKLTELLDTELAKAVPSIRNVKELNSEIRSDEIELNKLKNIYQEKYSVEIETGGSIKQILKVLAGKK